VTRLRFLGDIVITTPVIRAIARCYPEASIYYLAEEQYAPILEGNPYLEGVLNLRKGLAGTVRIIRELRKLKLTAALDLFYNPRSANILFLAGIPIRIGGSRRSRRMLYTENFSVPASIRSAVRHHLSALKAIGCRYGDEIKPRVYLRDAEIENGRTILSKFSPRSPADRLTVAVHPGGTWQSKRWPPARFAELINLINEDMGAQAVLITGPGEKNIVQMVAGSCRSRPGIIPFLPVREVAAVMNSADAVVANDGGIMHLSVALDLPTIGVFGPTEPDIWFPYVDMGPFSVVTRDEECAPCHLHSCSDLRCLTGITAKEVYGELYELIGRG
jgi:ADP-heptose:LPS heptosyltransferase